MVVLTWKYLGLAIVLFLAGLAGVPDELYEAAQIDGASWWQVQRKVAIPLLGPTVRTWAFLSMIGSIQVFDMVWILTGGGPAESTNTMATFLYGWGVDRNLIGIASAASVILFVIALVFALTYQRFVLRRDLGDTELPGGREGSDERRSRSTRSRGRAPGVRAAEGLGRAATSSSTRSAVRGRGPRARPGAVRRAVGLPHQHRPLAQPLGLAGGLDVRQLRQHPHRRRFWGYAFNSAMIALITTAIVVVTGADGRVPARPVPVPAP